MVANRTYIDTLPFDGLMVKFPDNQNCLGPNYVVNYNTLYSQIGPMKNALAKVTHNYAVAMIGNSGMVDPFDNWTQTQANFVTLAQVCRDAGLEGIVYDNEEYNVHMWQYPGRLQIRQQQDRRAVPRAMAAARDAGHAGDHRAMAASQDRRNDWAKSVGYSGSGRSNV